MSHPRKNPNRPDRRGAIVVLAAFFIVVMLGMIAFSVDLGYLQLTRTQLQTAADASALAAGGASNLSRAEMEAVAQQFATANRAAGQPARVASEDIQYGTWDLSRRTFSASNTPGNAVRVTARTTNTPMFFARIFGVNSVSQEASAVATLNPRDICFVVDLSGSMNDDTDPDETAGINSNFAAQGYPTIGSDLLNQVYADFGINATHPNEPKQWIGQSIGVTSGGDALNKLMNKTGPLAQSSIPVKYRILSSDSSSKRKQKAYSWAMDVQIRALMPAAKPTPNSTANYSYWADYLDDNYSQLGYRSYLQFMMYNGRDRRPDGATYTPLSTASSDCPWHSEATAGGTFNFPPREQPTHAARRALIAAIQLVKDRNQNISDTNQRDWVSIVTFDNLSNGGPIVQRSLTGDYDSAMQSCTSLQACSDDGASTATEAGLIAARNHIKPQSQGGSGRTTTDKIVVLLTDGMPNLYQSSSTAITNYISAHPSADFYSSSDRSRNASLMQTMMMQGDHWYLYPVGIGLGCDYDFMDRMARTGATANQNGEGPRGSGNPGDYEARLTELFQNIVTNPKLRLVQ